LRVLVVNPSDKSFGIGVITPRWLYVLAAATPASFGNPVIVDETLDQLDVASISAGDVVGIGIHTGNALRGYEIGRLARQRGAFVVFGGVHATLFPDEAHELGGAHAVVKGDGDTAWTGVLEDCKNHSLKRVYAAGRIEASAFQSARWDLLPRNRYMWASVQTVRGCPKHCSFCSVWRTDGQRPRIRSTEMVVHELQHLRRLGFRFVLLADDNFYPVSLTDLKLASRQGNTQRVEELKAIRAERFQLMERLATDVSSDMVFFTQITMEAAEDPAFLEAMSRAKIKGALVGVEAVTPQGLKDIYKDFNAAGDELVNRLRQFPQHGVKVLGSFIFGLPSDLPETFEATLSVAQKADLAFAQFVMLMPFPGTVDFERWEKAMQHDPTRIAGFPLTRHWLIPRELRPKVFSPHPVMSGEEIRQRTQHVWDKFYSFGSIWRRAHCVTSLKSRLAFLLISKLYRQMYANTGIAIDSARLSRSVRWARWMAKPCRMLFSARPLPDPR
jgi:radical SAM superfamily enzyme YgiQ (UPF0313 family)